MSTEDIYKKHKILKVNEKVKLENYKLWHKAQLRTLLTNLIETLKEDHNQNTKH